MLLFADDKPTLWRWRAALVDRLTRLRLTLHAAAHPRPVDAGVPFLGFAVLPDRRRLKRRKGIHFQRNLRRLAAGCRAGAVPRSAVTTSVQGWVNHVRYANTIGLRKAIFGEGVRQDNIAAYTWFSLAAAQSSAAVTNRDSAATQMTPEQIAEAQRLAREWKPTDQP